MLRERIDGIRNDKLVLISCLVALIELMCNTHLMIETDFRIEPVIRVCFYVLYLIGIIFLQKKCVYIGFTVLAYIILYFNKFQNYTSFFIICIVCFKFPKYKVPLLTAYVIDVVLALILGNRSASHALIHILNCGFIYTFFLCELAGKDKLNLTADERIILEEWTEKQEMKQLESFSKNITFKKLKEARERNKIATNEELLERYKIETELVQKR